MVNKVNPLFKEIFNNKKKENEQLMSFNNGILSIDFKQMDFRFNEIINWILDNKIKLLTSLGDAAFTGISAALLYRGITAAYSKSLINNLENKLIKKNLTKEELKDVINNQKESIKIFNKSRGVLITILFYIVIQTYKTYNPINVNINPSTHENNNDTIKNSMLSIFILLNKKTPKWIKFMILFFIFSITVYYISDILLFVKSKNFLYLLRIGVFLMLWYNLFIYIIIRLRMK